MNAAYAEAAKALHDLADRMAALADHTGLDGAKPPHISIDIMPREPHSIDIVAEITGASARTKRMRDGTFHRAARGRVGVVWVAVFNEVDPPDQPAQVRAAEALHRFGVAS